jgi:hypothetical protein
MHTHFRHDMQASALGATIVKRTNVDTEPLPINPDLNKCAVYWLPTVLVALL